RELRFHCLSVRSTAAFSSMHDALLPHIAICFWHSRLTLQFCVRVLQWHWVVLQNCRHRQKIKPASSEVKISAFLRRATWPWRSGQDSNPRNIRLEGGGLSIRATGAWRRRQESNLHGAGCSREPRHSATSSYWQGGRFDLENGGGDGIRTREGNPTRTLLPATVRFEMRFPTRPSLAGSVHPQRPLTILEWLSRYYPGRCANLFPVGLPISPNTPAPSDPGFAFFGQGGGLRSRDLLLPR